MLKVHLRSVFWVATFLTYCNTIKTCRTLYNCKFSIDWNIYKYTIHQIWKHWRHWNLYIRGIDCMQNTSNLESERGKWYTNGYLCLVVVFLHELSHSTESYSILCKMQPEPRNLGWGRYSDSRITSTCVIPGSGWPNRGFLYNIFQGYMYLRLAQCLKFTSLVWIFHILMDHDLSWKILMVIETVFRDISWFIM